MCTIASVSLAALLFAAAADQGVQDADHGVGGRPAAATAAASPSKEASPLAKAMSDRLTSVERVLTNRRLELAGGAQPAGARGTTRDEERARIERLLRHLTGQLAGLQSGDRGALASRLQRARAELGRLHPQATAPGPEATTGAGTISGRVTNQLTGAGVAGVRVDAWIDSVGSLSAWTDSQGYYAVGGLASGTYVVATYSGIEGLFDELYDDIPCPGGLWVGCYPASGTPIDVADGATTAGIDLALLPGGTVTGRIRDAASATALEGVTVILWKPAGGWQDSSATDPAGRYRFSRVPAGTYFVTTRSGSHRDELFDDLPCPNSCDVTTGTPVLVAAGAVTPGIDFALERLGTISGTVTDAGTGLAVPFVEVEAVPVNGAGAFSSYTDAAGRYSVGGLLPGSYFVSTADYWDYRDELYDNVPCPGRFGGCDLEDGTPVAVSFGGHSSGVDFVLDRFGAISGEIVDSVTGTLLPNASVSIYDEAGVLLGSFGWEGVYETNGLLDGTYFALATRFGYQPLLFDAVACPGEACDPTTGTPITVGLNQSATGIDFALVTFGSISGVVSHAGSGARLAGSPVEVWNADGDRVRETSTNASGEYVATALEPGSYYVVAVDNEYSSELYDDVPCPSGQPAGCDLQAAVPVVVTLSTDTPGIDFALRRLGVVTGSVTDAHSGAPALVSIEAWSSTGSYLGSTTNDVTGSYTLTGLPGSEVFVAAGRPSWDSHIGQLHAGIPCNYCNPTSGTPIPVAIDTVTAGIDFALDFGPGVRGIVVARGSWAPLPGVAIDVWGPGGELIETAATDTAGEYSLRLLPGTYYVSTDAGLGGIDELWNDIHCPSGPAREGLCDPTHGDPATVMIETPAIRVDFALSVILLFADGFESGDSGAWSAAVP